MKLSIFSNQVNKYVALLMFAFILFAGHSSVSLIAVDPPILTVDKLNDFVNQMEKKKMAGVLYARINGKVEIKRAFGYANKKLGIKNNINTVFGTGSRPIDYTMAAILLLDQQGIIRLDDPVKNYLDGIPIDKSSITLRHLMTGGSGLPDFFDNNTDWDPDLAWIDRDAAVNRIMAQKLIFPPGTKREHSHGAFGLLAAVIEKVSKKSYYSFIREHFLDPAGMKLTGEYGEIRGNNIIDFAVGGGPQKIGLPNIPPNWGPTSWLIKGSGGMYSTLEDQLSFYNFIRSGKILDKKHASRFKRATFSMDGSDRGFELFSAFKPHDTEIFLFLNESGPKGMLDHYIFALEGLVRSVKK